MDLMTFIDNTILFLGNYAFLVIILLGIAHGITDNPWSFLTMSLSLTLLPIPIAFIVLLLSNYLGTAILYFMLHHINKKSNNYFYQKRVSKKVLVWLEEQPIWKHIIVIGMPLVPTIQFRLALPFTNISFKRYMAILIGVYLFLYASYSLVYFGALSILEGRISEPVAVLFLIVVSILIYFGKNIRDKLFTSKLKSEVE